MAVTVKEVKLLSEKPVWPEGFKPWERVLDSVKAEIPTDGVEVVEWMQECEAANRVLDFFGVLYGFAGGKIEYVTGDGYIPGVRSRNYCFEKRKGREVKRRGYAIVLPTGTRVPVGGWAWVKFPEVLGAVGRTYGVQYNALLLFYERLPSIPNSARVTLPRVWGMTLPVVYLDPYRLPTPMSLYRLRVTASRKTTLRIRWWGGGKPYAEAKAEVKKGQSEVVLAVSWPRTGYLEVYSEKNVDVAIDRIDRLPPV